MTVLIALEHPDTGEKAIAADGRCSSGRGIVSESRRKIMRAGKAFAGLSGAALVQSVVTSHLAAYDFSDGETLAMDMRKWLADAGMWKWEESGRGRVRRARGIRSCAGAHPGEPYLESG